jgi:O-antigen/teichoic acid export membrane protein
LFSTFFITNFSRIRRLAKEGLWVVSGQVVSVVGALILIRVLTEYLNPSEYGNLALGLTAAALVNQVVLGGVTAGIGRFYSIASEKNDLLSYLSASRELVGIATLVVVIVAVLVVVVLFALGYSKWVGLTVAAFLFSLLSGCNAILTGIQNSARNREIASFHGVLDAVLKIPLAIGMMLWVGASSMAAILGYALSSLIVTVSQIIFLKRLTIQLGTVEIPNSNWRSQIWSYSWPFSVFGIFTWMQQISDRWALQTFSTEHEVGLYAVVFQLGFVPIGIVTGIAMTFMAPIFYQRSGDAKNLERNISVHRLAWRITNIGLFITALASGFAFFMHAQIFQLLVSEKYSSVSSFLPWVILAGGFFACGQMLALKLMSEMKSTSMTIAKIVTSIIGMSMSFYGSYNYGLKGVVLSLVVFTSIYFIWMAFITQASYKLIK